MLDKATRRRFSLEDKQRIAQEFLACTGPEQRGALVRREGLYYGQAKEWADALAQRGFDALRPQPTGPKPKVETAANARVLQLERELATWKTRAERAEALCDVQKKLSQLLGLLSNPSSARP